MTNTSETATIYRTIWLIAAIGILGFSWVLNGPIYDEGHYLQNTIRFATGELNWWEFSTHRGPTGPGYAWVHAILWRIFPSMTLLRISNALLIISSSILIASCRRFDWKAALLLLVFPGIWVSSALALTEAISVFFISAGLFVYSKSQNHGNGVMALFALAISIGLAAFSRQTLIVTGCAFPLLWIWSRVNGKFVKPGPYLLAFFLVFVIPIPMFLEWSGLLPKDDFAHEQITSQGIFAINHVAYGMAYILLFLRLLDAKGWLNKILPEWKSITGLFVLCFFSCLACDWQYAPMTSILSETLGIRGLQIVATIFPAVSLTMCFALAWRGFKRLKPLNLPELSDLELFAVFACLTIIFSNGAITHQFSTRYLTMCAPFLASIAHKFPTRPILIGGFLFLNFLSLYSYT